MEHPEALSSDLEKYPASPLRMSTPVMFNFLPRIMC
jgi:hypothetical protein